MVEEVKEKQVSDVASNEQVEDDSLTIHYPKGFLVKTADLRKVCDDLKNIRDYLLKKQNFLEVTISSSKDEIVDLSKKIKSLEDAISDQNRKIEGLKKPTEVKLKDVSKPRKHEPISKKVLNDIKMSMSEDIKKYVNDIAKEETKGMKKIERELQRTIEKELKKRMNYIEDEIKKFEKDLMENIHDNVKKEMEKIEAKKKRKALKEAEKVEPFTLTKKEKEIVDLLNGGLKPKEISIITNMDIDEVKKIIKIIKKKVKI
ncbi:MAG: hypothetical protein J7K87_03595 [Candidatus Aenigmarchaeota archaeon]|nr:hypothetical protein [Candidatus Aenigmarchaeota archaeon]